MVTEEKQSACSRSQHLESKSQHTQHQKGLRRSWVLKYAGEGQSEEHVVKKKCQGMTWNWVGTVKRMVQRERKVTGKCDSWVCCVLSRFSCCLILCDPMNCSPPGSSVREILQARILECVAISYSRGSSPPRDRTRISNVSCIGRQVLYH